MNNDYIPTVWMYGGGRQSVRIATLILIAKIYDVATGQEQVAFDDTLGLQWIAEYITEQKKIP